ncbi:MAG: DUF4922 domain-containing protein [Cyanobacteria bacterium J06554_11]
MRPFTETAGSVRHPEKLAACPMTGRIPWQAGSLWSKLKAQTRHGLEVGALQPVETQVEYLPCDLPADSSVNISAGDFRFTVHILANLSRKQKARSQQGKTAPANPFLPYEDNLYVTDVSASHLCLLNKFNVVDHHFLIVTRQFEPQENWLTLADFEALSQCLGDVNGLAFYNAGTLAGASQPHKHLQVVPYTDALLAFPIEHVITETKLVKQEANVWTSPLLPFEHAIALLGKNVRNENRQQTDNATQAKQYLVNYRSLLNAVGINHRHEGGADDVLWQGAQTAPYNLVCTRQWLMVVPRSQEKFVSISVNSLGFAGSLLVKNQQKLDQLRQIGPMKLLQKVGCPRVQ